MFKYVIITLAQTEALETWLFPVILNDQLSINYRVKGKKLKGRRGKQHPLTFIDGCSSPTPGDRQTDSMWSSLNKQWQPVVLKRLLCVPALLCRVNIPVWRAQSGSTHTHWHTLTELHEKPRPVRDDLVIQPVKWVRARGEEVLLCSMLHASKNMCVNVLQWLM